MGFNNKNKIMTKLTYLFCTILLCLYGCTPQNKIAGNYSYDTECMGIEMDGSQTLKAWGNGRNRWDAIEQAKKNAVNDVIFKGIIHGRSECNKRPLIAEPNARLKYEDYFNAFFADEGEYTNFITEQDERILQKIARDRKGARESVTHGLVVRVLRSELKKKLLADQILK
jgi:hypothetical protein